MLDNFATATFDRQFRLTKTDEFSSVFGFHRCSKSSHLILYFRPNTYTHPRIGIIVGKRVSKLAVRRNYMRRILRELFRRHRIVLQEVDFIIRVHKTFMGSKIVETEFQNLVSPFLKPV